MSRATHVLDVIIVSLAPVAVAVCGLGLLGNIAAGHEGAAVWDAVLIAVDVTFGLISARSLRAERRAKSGGAR